MRVIFMGTPDFAVPTLQALVDAGHEVALVVSQPDKPVGRGKKLTSPPVIQRARELGLETVQPKAMRSGPFPERFVATQADVAVVIAYGRILPQRLLDAPRLGCLNVHASLLPRWRGAAPIQAAVLAGDATSGVCVQQMVQALDEGPIHIERAVELDPRETAGTLHDRLSLLAAEAAVAALDGLEQRTPVPQQGEPTYVGKIDRDAGLLDLGGDAAALDRQIRAMSPWPGGWVPWSEGPLKVLCARPVEGQGPAGTVLSVGPELVIACGTGALALEQVRAPGRKAVSGRDFANGAHLDVGSPFAPQE